MDNNLEHIEQILKEKLEGFAPTPPDTIWAGIENGLDKPAFKGWPVKMGIAAALLLLILASFWFLNPNQSEKLTEPHASSNTIEVQQPEVTETTNTETTVMQTDHVPGSTQTAVTEHEDSPNENLTESTEEIVQNDLQAEAASAGEASSELENQSSYYADKPIVMELPSLKSTTKSSLSLIVLERRPISLKNDFDYFLQQNSLSLSNPGLSNTLPPPALPQTEEAGNMMSNHWKLALFITPEYPIKQYDSISLSTAYTISVEPYFFFKKHWFVRSGLGLNLSRDQGFAQLDLSRYELMGTYDDVYDITFDTIGGIVTPTYHTNMVEIWDSVRHNGLVDVSNSYQYVQIPMVLGYHFGMNKFEFSFYGGMAVNFLVGSQIDMVEDKKQDATVHHYYNKLPQRANSYSQLWLGAGVEYRLGHRISISAEPNFRYLLNPIYSEAGYKQYKSLFAMRFGFVYQLSNKD